MNPPIVDQAVACQSAVTAYANPARLALTARLFGVEAPPLAGARVLQIGEHVAANLVALAAANPETQFVGLELAGSAAGEQPFADALPLDNLRIQPLPLDRLTDSPAGSFHYIVCAGSLGRLTAPQRSALLHHLAACLAPGGVVCLGYACLPGGHWPQALTAMLRQHVATVSDIGQRVTRARGLLTFLAQSNDDASAYGQLLKQTKAQFDLMSDLQIELEYLAPAAAPVALTELLQAAAVAGLTYLGDLDLPSMTDIGVPETARQGLNEIRQDPVRYEQYLDFVRGRAYRHTLLVAHPATVDRQVTPQRIAAVSLASPARPAAANIVLADGIREDFQHPHGAVLHVDNGITKAALAELARRWPQAVPFAELLTTAAAEAGRTDDATTRTALATDLLGYFANGLIELHLAPLPLTTDLGALPCAWPLARLQAARQASGPAAWVSNLRHENVPLDAFSREVLARLDGTQDRPALIAHLQQAVRDGRLQARAQADAEPITDPARLDALLVESLDVTLRRLAASGLLQA